MSDYISSKASKANSLADRLASAAEGLGIGSLYGVDDDNTLAESGVYNTHDSIRGTLAMLRSAIQADAGHIRTAAEVVDQADLEAAKEWGSRFMEESGLGGLPDDNGGQ